MNALFKSLATGLLVTSLTSCDYVAHHYGFVRDDQTGRPIENATVTFSHEQYKTDSLGYFEIDYFGGHPTRHFIVEKTSYITGRLTMEYKKDITFYGIEPSEVVQKIPHNSMNFEIKDDTLIFFLKKITENLPASITPAPQNLYPAHRTLSTR